MALDPIKARYPSIFLSASIPTPDRAPRYFETADVIAIRDSIKALVAAIIPKYALVWGGHPSITPMIRLLAESHRDDVRDYFVLYQSRSFRNVAPKDNEFFRHVIWVEGSKDIQESLGVLRHHMLSEPNYVAGVFIGGMDGIEEEFREFRRMHRKCPIFPIASTGGAAKILFNEWSKPLGFNSMLNSMLQDEVAYPFLFRRLLSDPRLSAR
jgi:SLOG cluster3 family